MSHFTAVLLVERVTEAIEPKVDQYGKTTNPGTPRKASEVTKIVVRADTMEKLKQKITAHTDLIEEN
jgi:hypothetical protein